LVFAGSVAMRYLFLGLKLAVFIVLLLLAMQNSQLVSLNLLLGGVWEAPLILLLLAFFAVGAAFGLAAGFTYSLKLRRQLTALKKELRARQQTQVTHDPSDSIAD
jgi:putative membrane protein